MRPHGLAGLNEVKLHAVCEWPASTVEGLRDELWPDVDGDAVGLAVLRDERVEHAHDAVTRPALSL